MASPISLRDPVLVPAREQHHLPAALIGGFGRPVGTRLRDAEVLWRRREWSAPNGPVAARYIGWKKDMYRLENPPPDIDPESVDSLWTDLERVVMPAIRQAEHQTETSNDQGLLLNHVATAGVRHPDFAEALNRWRAARDEPPVTGDDIQADRVRYLCATLSFVRDLRWRFLHSPQRAHPFILSDRGWTYVGQTGRRGRGLFVPLNRRVALLGWRDPTGAKGFDHRTLRPSWVRWLNAATWSDAPQFVVGHPDDAPLLKRLSTPDRIAPSLNGNGPYKGMTASLFDP